jgi:hypothetical protein
MHSQARTGHFLRSEQANFTLGQATLRLDGHLCRTSLRLEQAILRLKQSTLMLEQAQANLGTKQTIPG